MVSIVNAYRDLVRLRQITTVLVRHGFGEVVSRIGLGRGGGPADAEITVSDEEFAAGELAKKQSMGVRLRLVAQELGPSFVKLGQIASTRADILPEDWVVELKKLQDDVPQVPWADIEREVEASLARPLEEVFESFEERPLAAASIGQVHRAVLKTPDGPRDVVVKVQRPGVGETIARDMDLLYVLARLIERTIPEARVYSLVGMVENFDRSITAELDYGIEAENSRKFQKNFEHQPEVRFPFAYRDVSTRNVLVLEFLPGKKVHAAIADGHSGQRITKIATGMLIKMIFEDGFFHADPHPGNILICGPADATVFGMVDLGMVGRLSPDMREKTIDLMIAAVRGDAIAVADALYAIGTPTKKVDMRAYRAEASMLAEKYLGKNLKDMKLGAMLTDIVGGATKYGIEIPPEFLMVGKTLMTLDGIGKEIDPDLDFFEEAKPYFVDLLKKRYSPERILNELWRVAERISGAAYDVPQQLREVLEDLRLGRLMLKTENPGADLAVDRLGRRIFSGLAFGALVLGACALLSRRPGDRDAIAIALLGLAALVAVVHIVRDRRR